MAARSIEELQKRYASLGKLPKGGPGGGPRGRDGPRPKGKPKNTKKTVSRLLGYVEKYKLRLVLVLFAMLISTEHTAIASTATPIIMVGKNNFFVFIKSPSFAKFNS